MYLLTGILMLATFIALLAVIFGRDKKKNLKTFFVALVLWIIVAAIAGNQ